MKAKIEGKFVKREIRLAGSLMKPRVEIPATLARV
jgi:hypothetical protein